MMQLKALAINCTLKRSGGDQSSTGGMITSSITKRALLKKDGYPGVSQEGSDG